MVARQGQERRRGHNHRAGAAGSAGLILWGMHGVEAFATGGVVSRWVVARFGMLDTSWQQRAIGSHRESSGVIGRHMAKLYFTHGTMGAQKTTDLLATAYNFEEHGGTVLLTKPATDTKGDADVVSRIGLRRRADFLTTPDMDIEAEVLRRRAAMEHIHAVLVDEAQFLQPAQVDQLLRLAAVHAIPVMAWGLRTDFRTHAFPGSQRLLEAAHELRESIAMCGHGGGCEHRAQFNARLVNGRFVAEGDQVAIDGEAAVTYTALCARHYLEDVGPIAARAADAH